MFVKHDEDGKLVALFIGCVPDDAAEYEEVPDDEEAAQAFFAQQRAQQTPTQPTDADRIAALEEQLAAAKILLGVE